jgi:hypothetical protein
MSFTRTESGYKAVMEVFWFGVGLVTGVALATFVWVVNDDVMLAKPLDWDG